MLFKKEILSFLACAVGALGVQHRNRATPSVFLLAGDSTTARQSDIGGGKFPLPSPTPALHYFGDTKVGSC